jgi:hypothetical protein
MPYWRVKRLSEPNPASLGDYSASKRPLADDSFGSRSDPLPVRPNRAATVARFQEPRRARRLSIIQMSIRPSNTNRERFLDLGAGKNSPLLAGSVLTDLESDSLSRRATLNVRVAR